MMSFVKEGKMMTMLNLLMMVLILLMVILMQCQSGRRSGRVGHNLISQPVLIVSHHGVNHVLMVNLLLLLLLMMLIVHDHEVRTTL